MSKLAHWAIKDRDQDTPNGLRESKKLALREALSIATVQLAREMQSAVDHGARAATALLSAAIADRLELSLSDDPRPSFVANAALSTLLVALERWVGLPQPEPLLPLLREAFQRLGDGLDRLR